MIHGHSKLLQLKKTLGKPVGKLPFPVILGILAIFLLLVPLDATVAYALVFKGKIYPNVAVAGHNLGGLTPGQAQEQLTALAHELSPDSLTIRTDSQEWAITTDSLEVSYDATASVNSALAVGRDQDLFHNLQARWKLTQTATSLPFATTLNRIRWQETMATISAQVEQPAIPPTIKLEGQNQTRKVVVDNGQAGKEVDRESLTQLLEQRLAFLNHQPLELPIIPVLSPITQIQAEATKQRADRLLNKSIVLKSADQAWTLTDEELINFLDFANGLDETKIASWTAQLATSLNRPPQNALFRFENGRVIEFKPALAGVRLDEAQTSQQIFDAVETLQNQAESILTILVPVTVQEPQISTAQVNDLGIKELIGKGESWFRGSIASRVHNIRLAAEKINGILVAPGETFSFNQAVGEIDASTGFQQAYVIKDGRTVLGDGGGVCQVSTTLFRAALNTGLPIEERRAHAYRVSYYEQNTAVGQDATVFAPSPDFKFKNDTPGHILIQMKFDAAQAKLTFELYGTSDGRQVTVSQTRLWDQVPPPPDLHQDDPTLPTGTVKQVDWKAWGAKAAFDWKVTRGSEVLQERTFASTYRPWQAVFLHGTGG
jgi:vancomycin resistance protein YoaR